MTDGTRCKVPIVMVDIGSKFESRAHTKNMNGKMRLKRDRRVQVHIELFQHTIVLSINCVPLDRWTGACVGSRTVSDLVVSGQVIVSAHQNIGEECSLLSLVTVYVHWNLCLYRSEPDSL